MNNGVIRNRKTARFDTAQQEDDRRLRDGLLAGSLPLDPMQRGKVRQHLRPESLVHLVQRASDGQRVQLRAAELLEHTVGAER